MIAFVACVAFAGSPSVASACDSGRSCTFSDTGAVSDGCFWTCNFSFVYESVDFRAHSYSGVGGSAQDSATSFYNNGNSSSVRYYRDINQVGPSFFDTAPGGYYANLVNYTGAGGVATWNDKFSSGCFLPYC